MDSRLRKMFNFLEKTSFGALPAFGPLSLRFALVLVQEHPRPMAFSLGTRHCPNHMPVSHRSNMYLICNRTKCFRSYTDFVLWKQQEWGDKPWAILYTTDKLSYVDRHVVSEAYNMGYNVAVLIYSSYYIDLFSKAHLLAAPDGPSPVSQYIKNLCMTECMEVIIQSTNHTEWNPKTLGYSIHIAYHALPLTVRYIPYRRFDAILALLIRMLITTRPKKYCYLM